MHEPDWLALLNEVVKKDESQPTNRTHKLGRKRTQYPTFTEGGPVRWREKEMRCASWGCGCPTHYTFKGVPYCSLHMIRLLAHLLLANSTGVVNDGTGTNGSSDSERERNRDGSRSTGDGTISVDDEGRRVLNF